MCPCLDFKNFTQFNGGRDEEGTRKDGHFDVVNNVRTHSEVWRFIMMGKKEMRAEVVHTSDNRMGTDLHTLK